jgi:hypothetical protein
MNKEYVKTILNNKITQLQSQKVTAEHFGNLDEVVKLDGEIADTQATLEALN